MRNLKLLPALIALAHLASAQTVQNGDFRIALPDHAGQLSWSIAGFKIIESSAKPNGREIGIRDRDASGRITFLGFLFLAPETAPLTGAKCRDAALALGKKANSTIKILTTSEISRPNGLPVALATYSAANRDGSIGYRARGFVATSDICGDLEFYSTTSISDRDSDLRAAFQSFQLEPSYSSQFGDLMSYAQILFQHHDYSAAGPLFERALSKVPADGAPFDSAKRARRVTRDQAGMSYGISGDLARARNIFEKGIAEDPDYPLYYYNLACADAGENKLADARIRLQQAFDRKANINSDESMPVPTQDDSFLPFKGNKEFWTFLERLQAGK